MDLKSYIREVPDFPKPGILFRDITPLLQEPMAFGKAIDALVEHYEGHQIDTVVGIEARGFLLAAPMALRMQKALVPVRKEGKLPSETRAVQYSLEYGSSVVEMHSDAISDGHRVLIVDDLLATGGTLSAATRLVRELGGRIAGIAVLIELTDLNGRDRLADQEIFSLMRY